MNERSVPEMIEWVKRIGYQVRILLGIAFF